LARQPPVLRDPQHGADDVQHQQLAQVPVAVARARPRRDDDVRERQPA